MSDQEIVTTEAHIEHRTIHLIYYFPDHTPRRGDKHYKLFTQARNRMKKLGLLKCYVCGTTDNIELHHSTVEFALQNGVDIEKFKHLFPDLHIESDEDFATFVESSDQNLTALCHDHHTGIHGVHCLDSVTWNSLRFWKDDIHVAGEKDSDQ